jgi:hypothetical protein
MKVGGVRSDVHVTVLEVVAVFPQASIAVKVLVWDFVQTPLTAPSLCVIVGDPHASVAEADPSAALISLATGSISIGDRKC